MTLVDFTDSDLISISKYKKTPLQFIYNENNRFDADKEEIQYSISREYVDDILHHNLFYYIITKSTTKLNEVKALKDLIYEDLCLRKWYKDNPGKYPENAQYSHCVNNYDKFRYIIFADEMVEAIITYYKGLK